MRVGAPTLVETGLVFAGRRGRAGDREVRDLIGELGVIVVLFGEAEWRLAADAFGRYGRGRHEAALNFGDCLAYATATAAGDSLNRQPCHRRKPRGAVGRGGRGGYGGGH